MKKWNPATNQYEPYSVPAEWHCPPVSFLMDELINCASCGKRITFGAGYTSKLIHTDSGFGYTVCRECSEKEAVHHD